MTDKQIYPVTHKYKPRNREERRVMVFERDKIIDRLVEIEASFIIHLFSAEFDSYSYQVLYAFHLERYIEMVKWINKERTPKYCIVHENYFADMYKPMEVSENE